tara:strand:+ start:1795 stop:2205 length:411 start_codon:yes stop_codon:yes gene_type:complete
MVKEKTTIGKGEKKRKVPKEYVPKGLSKADKKKQEKSILEGKKRPKVDFKNKRSGHAERFEKKYGYKISNLSRVSKEIISREGINQILSKGRGAYYSAGSRPNQTAQSWALARLASVIMGGNARRVDSKIWNKYKK